MTGIHPDGVAPSARAIRLLLVEDSATQAAALAVLLEREGYDTLVARRAQLALDTIRTTPVDLVLSDVVMPGMDGYELCASSDERLVTFPLEQHGECGRLRGTVFHDEQPDRARAGCHTIGRDTRHAVSSMIRRAMAFRPICTSTTPARAASRGMP